MSEVQQKVGVLGLGIIGAAWASNWQADGLLGATWNRTPKPELPGFCENPQDVAGAADVLVIVVADPPAVESVVEEILPALRPHHIVIQSSTIDPANSERFAKRVAEAGARYLEAPFTGSKPAAEARETVFYLGGDATLIREVEPLLARISKARLHIGSGPQAARLKLAMNLQIALQAQALSESLRFCRDAGISDEVFFNALSCNAAASGLTRLKEPKLRSHDYAPQFSIKHMHKDMRLATETARDLALPLPLLRTIEERLQQAVNAGLGDEDFIALYKLLEE